MSFVGYCHHDRAKQVALNQLGASACGKTALVTVMLMLQVIRDEDVATLDWSNVIVRCRANTSPLPQYLLSRYNAGCTGEELVESMKAVLHENKLEDLVECMPFVPFFPIDPSTSIVDYLSDMFTQGCIIVATFNLQVLGNDAWHHQVVYGVDRTNGLVYCTNPLEPYSEDLVRTFLSTKSLLLIRKEDILSRLDILGGDDSLYDSDPWQRFQIPKQIEALQHDPSMEYVVITAAYVGGFAVFKKKT